MNTTVFLIRHGALSNPNNILYGSNIPMELSEEGKKQIKHLGQELKDKGISKIYTSPLQRTKDSSAILAKEIGIDESKIEVVDALKDSDIPAIAGKPRALLEEIRARGKDAYSEEYVTLGNESREHLRQRVLGAFYKVVKENPGKTIAIISHGDPILVILYLLKHYVETLPSLSSLKIGEYPQVGSATKIVINDKNEIMEMDKIK